MIDIFIREETEFGPRIELARAANTLRAQNIIALLEAVGIAAGGRPANQRQGSVAKLIAQRDAALDREIARRAAKKRPKAKILRLENKRA